MRRALVSFMTASPHGSAFHHRICAITWPATDEVVGLLVDELAAATERNREQLVIISISWLEPELGVT